MKDGKTPNPNVIHPIKGYENEIYIKPTISNPNIVVGDFSYIADSDFESHVKHHYEWNGDKLIIGKFCQIAAGVEFVMNGANHQMNAVSTFPFYTLEGWDMEPPAMADLPLKGDTVIGNDEQYCLAFISVTALSLVQTALSGVMFLPIRLWLEILQRFFANALMMK